MRTTGQVTGAIGAAASLAALTVWLLGRWIGLSADETNVLGPAFTGVYAAAGTWVAPWFPKRETE